MWSSNTYKHIHAHTHKGHNASIPYGEILNSDITSGSRYLGLDMRSCTKNTGYNAIAYYP